MDSISGTEADLFWCSNEDVKVLARGGVELSENINNTVSEAIRESVEK